MLFQRSQIRSKSGLAVALPMVIIATTIILVLGLFSFEVGRMAIARDQLQSTTESAALAGAAALAGSTDADITLSQQKAVEAAKQVFRANDIFGNSLSGALEASGVPSENQAFLSFRFLDPSNNEPVQAGDPRGKALEVTSVYGLASLAGKVIGLGNAATVVNAKSSGGVGQLDVVLCFDCSGSMRFKTFTSRVRRSFNTTTGKIDYTVVQRMFDTTQGGMTPQMISGLNAQLRGATDNSMPGNTPPGSATNNGFTDWVVNIDEQSDFGSFTEGTFTFPNIAALVEASRGNLENEAVFQSSGAALTLAGVVTPQAGYKAKYFELARKHTHPWAEAETAAKNFFQLMKTNTQARFGLVGFNQIAGTAITSGYQERNVADNYPQGGSGFFPVPGIALRPVADGEAADEQNFGFVNAALDQMVPNGNTNIGDAIDQAQRMFTPTTTRPNAKKVIVLFTDGIPTAGPNPAGFTAIMRNKGIAVFSVGLNLDPDERAQQAQVLSQISQGAGNGGKFFQVTDPSKLNGAFSSIARGLTQIVQ